MTEPKPSTVPMRGERRDDGLRDTVVDEMTGLGDVGIRLWPRVERDAEQVRAELLVVLLLPGPDGGHPALGAGRDVGPVLDEPAVAAPAAGDERLGVVVRSEQLGVRVLGLQRHGVRVTLCIITAKSLLPPVTVADRGGRSATASSSASQSAGSDSGMATNLEVPTDDELLDPRPEPLVAGRDHRRRVGEVGPASGEGGDHDVGHIAVGVGDQGAPVLLVHGAFVRGGASPR